MNVPAAIEIAFAETLREHAALGAGVVVRPWQSLDNDSTWKSTKDRTFPMVSVQCAEPETGDSVANMAARCRIVCGTWNEDDKNHAAIRAMYGECRRVLRAVFSSRRKGVYTDSEIAKFKAILEASVDAGEFRDWALSWSGGDDPISGEGANFIGTTVVVHYVDPGLTA